MADSAPHSLGSGQVAHRLVRMVGRDPGESHRTATGLELLFDLTFVIGFSAASSELAGLVAVGHLGAGLAGFGFAMFAIIWAWINFTWFASAYDTDDWFYRLTTMVQMIGVLVLALGLPPMFASIDAGAPVDNAQMVAGYVVMRTAMVVQWLRAARQDPARRDIALTYVTTLVVAQIGWVVLIVVPAGFALTAVIAGVLVLIEVTGPVLAERKGGTPWHPHHIAERYGAMAIIALGEEVVGTVASLSAVIQGQGWTWQVVAVAVAGTALTFGMWWIYFALPFGDILQHRRETCFGWGYGHLVVFAAIAATGAGLHVAADQIAGAVDIPAGMVLAAVAVPVAIYVVAIHLLYAYQLGAMDPVHLVLLVATAAVLAAALGLAALGVATPVCLVVAALAPAVTVVGYETVGHRHLRDAVRRLDGGDTGTPGTSGTAGA